MGHDGVCRAGHNGWILVTVHTVTGSILQQDRNPYTVMGGSWEIDAGAQFMARTKQFMQRTITGRDGYKFRRRVGFLKS